jgi:hypothetical protein
MGAQQLKSELTELKANIDIQMSELSGLASQMGIRLTQVRNADGAFAATELLLAKAQVLNGLALLETIK